MGPELNYTAWKNAHQSILETFSQKEIMMLYSGGKDSSVVLHFMQSASNEFGFRFNTFAGIYPHHVFTSSDREKLNGYWKDRGVIITWQTLPEPDEHLDSALSHGVSPCLICNKAKKKALLAHLKAQAVDVSALVIVLSYSLWDLASASVEHTLTSSFGLVDALPAVQHKSPQERFFETAQRFYPFLKFNSGFGVFKPLIRYNDQEILKVIADEGIPILSSACRHREYRPKRIFARYYEKMNLRFDFEKVLDFARSAHHLPEERFFTQMGADRYLQVAI